MFNYTWQAEQRDATRAAGRHTAAGLKHNANNGEPRGAEGMFSWSLVCTAGLGLVLVLLMDPDWGGAGGLGPGVRDPVGGRKWQHLCRSEAARQA